MRILIMGLPGAGKTTFSDAVTTALRNQGFTVTWLNGDDIREMHNDWDFSLEGRLRQAERMRKYADQSPCQYQICDFGCPIPEMRDIYDATITIWIDTIKESRYQDTNKAFIPPAKYDVRVTSQDTDRWLPVILESLVVAHTHQPNQESTHSNNDL